MHRHAHKIRKYQRLISVLLFLSLLLMVIESSGLREHFNLDYLHHRIEDNRLAGLLLFVTLFVLGNLVHVPGWLFLGAAVLALGETYGGMVTYLAASISCMTTFAVIRLIGGDALRQLDNKMAVAILARLDAHPIRSIALLRVLFQTLPTLNYALALSGVRFRTYLIGTLLGLPLPIFIYCMFFEHLAKVFHISH